MAGYIRQDVTNNIATGNVINASDFDNEYNAIEAAFHASTGHTHDGTAAEGAPITKIGPTQDVVASASALTPKTDNTVDLGSSILEYKDLWIDGTANIDSLVADTADINAGTIDGVTIGGASAGAATFTTATATTGNITTVNATTVDATNVEVTNIKAKDGTASASIADATGVVSFSANPVLSAGTANGVAYLNGSKVLTTGSVLTYNGTALTSTASGAISGIFNRDTSSGATLQIQVVGNNVGTLGSDTGGNGRFDLAAATSMQLRATGSGSFMSFDANNTEQMRLTSTGLGIGTSSPQVKLEVSDSSAGAVSARITNTANVSQYLSIQMSGGTAFGVPGWDNSGVIEAVADGVGSGTRALYLSAYNGPLIFATGSGSRNERMRLDASGNLGIGTSSPGVKLDVVGSGQTISRIKGGTGTNQGSAFYVTQAGSSNTLSAFGDRAAILGGTPDQAVSIFTSGGLPLLFDISGTERMRLDSSGNLGLGVTPSAWDTPYRALDVLSAALAGNLSGPTTWLANNAYVKSGTGSTYKATAPAAAYLQYQNQHQWFTAPSGTAGDAISFTQSMTLDAIGNLGVGVTSVNAKLQVATTGASTGSLTTVSDFGAAGVVSIGKIAGNSQAVYLGTGDVQTGVNGGIAAGIGFMREASDWNSALAFYTNGTTDGVTTNRITERARITSGGSFQIGSSTGNDPRLFVYDNDSTDAAIVVRQDGAAPIQIWQGSGAGERARITSGGDLLVGTTSDGAGISGVTSRMAVVAATANFGGVFVTDSTAYHDLLCWNKGTSGDNAFIEFATEASYTARGSITYNRAGGLVAYNTTSDYRAKDIIGPVQDPGATIDALKVYEGVMKGATQSRPMLVAHEAQAVAPYAVSGVKDEVNEDGTPKFQQMDVSSLVPLLLAEIQSLRARVAALESN